MGWFGKKKDASKDTAPPNEDPLSRQERVLTKMLELYRQLPDNYWPEFDLVPFAHRPVFEYMESLWAGAPIDPDFEAKSLSRDFGMKGFNLAALFYLVAVAREIPTERVTRFLAPSTPGADDSICILFHKITVMAAGMDEGRYLSGLAAGVVLDPRQDHLNRVPLLPHADDVKFACDFAEVLERLKDQQLHAAVDVKHGDIEDDPEWRR